VDFTFVESLQLNFSRLIDPFTNDVGTFAGVFARQLLIAQTGYFDLDIDAVEQGAGNFRTIALNLQRRANAFLLRVGEEATDASLRYLSAM